MTDRWMIVIPRRVRPKKKGCPKAPQFQIIVTGSISG